ASYLLDAGERNHTLAELAQRYLKHPLSSVDDLLGSGKSRKQAGDLALEDITRCACEAVDVAWRLRPLLAEGLENARLEKLFADVEMPLVEVLSGLESTGVKIDVALLNDLSRKYGALVERLEGEIHQLAGRAFNIGSPKQLQQILFEEHKLPV